MNKPFISVLLAVHNGQAYVAQAIKSVLQQTYDNFELIICANGCTDNTVEVCMQAIKSTRNTTLLIRSETGKCNALNEMLKLAKGTYIAIQDADDIWLPNKLMEQLGCQHDYDVLGTLINYIDADGKPMDIPFAPVILHELIVDNAFSGKNPIANCTALIRKSLVIEVNGWDPAWEGVEDYELWLKLMSETNAKFYNLNSILALHRLHKGSHFNSKPDMQLNKATQLVLQYKRQKLMAQRK